MSYYEYKLVTDTDKAAFELEIQTQLSVGYGYGTTGNLIVTQTIDSADNVITTYSQGLVRLVP